MQASRLEEVMTDCDNQYRLVEKLSGGKVSAHVKTHGEVPGAGKKESTKQTLKKKDVVPLSPMLLKKIGLLKAKRELKIESAQNDYVAKTWAEIYKEHPELNGWRCVMAGDEVIKICPASKKCEDCKDCG